MRWSGQGCLKCEGVTILYWGHDDQHTDGVGIIISKEATQALIGWKQVNGRIIMITHLYKHRYKLSIIHHTYTAKIRRIEFEVNSWQSISKIIVIMFAANYNYWERACVFTAQRYAKCGISYDTKIVFICLSIGLCVTRLVCVKTVVTFSYIDTHQGAVLTGKRRLAKFI